MWRKKVHRVVYPDNPLFLMMAKPFKRHLICCGPTLPPSHSGTFLQTLPELVTYPTQGALFISAQLSTDAVRALEKFGY